jgi:hypothetical protein
MESHLSYPMLAYFRSQHDNQSWLAALTTILDTCSLILAALPTGPTRTARLTYAMCRHALVDLAQIFNTAPSPPRPERLGVDTVERLRGLLEEEGLTVASAQDVQRVLDKLRASYESYAHALAEHLALSLPDWLPVPEVTENWRSTAWEPGGRAIF